MSEYEPLDDKTRDTPVPYGGRLLHYRLISRIGAGGMGEVHLAQDEKLDRLVALKMLSSRLSSPQLRQKLLGEARASARLSHANICSIYAIEETEDQMFISMEYVQGTTLKDLLNDEQLDNERLTDITRQCCEGLAAAHRAGVVHRDIKSANIMVDKSGTVKILDFGLARMATDESETATAGIMGTYQYMSPEQISGKPVDHRSDIFSLAVVLYELITGKMPFQGDNIPSLAYSIVHNDPESISQHRPDVAENLCAITMRALSKDPDSRYQSAADILIDLGSTQTAMPAIHARTAHSAAAIAVFPFRNLSNDQESEYLSEGICDDVITAISKIPQLSVASRTAVRRLLKRDLDPLDISEELKARHFLEGSIRRQGNMIRLNAQITRTSDGFLVWSESYERMFDDIFTLQSDIAMQVATALNVALTDGQTPTALRPKVSGPEAYDLYLRGKFHLKQRNEASMIKAVELLSEAVRLDDSFVDAHAQLATAGVLCEIYGYSCDESIKNHAFEYAEKAVNLDPSSSQAHVSLYMALRMTDIRRSLTELRTAIALDSSNSDAYHYLGHSLAMFGHYKAAEKAELTASRLDPFLETCDASLCHIYYLTGQQEKLDERLLAMTKKYSQSYLVHSTYGWVEWCERHWEKAVEYYEKAHALEPSSEYTTDHLADCYIRSGQAQNAIEILNKGLSVNPDLWMLIARLGQAHAAAGDSESAEREAARAWAKFEETNTQIRHPETAQYHFQVAWQAALRNDRTTSLHQIKAAVARDYGNYLELRARPDWDILLGEPEFETLVDQLETVKISEDDD